MCGIVGLVTSFANGFTNFEIDAVHKMLFLDYFRGKDSTGVFCVTKDNEVPWVKMAAPPDIARRAADYADVFKTAIAKGKILVGHNRKATIGKVTSENAHPFVSDNVIMVHNGSLENHRQYFDTEVDSEALAKLLGQTETVKDVEEIFCDVSGAFSVVWYNVKSGLLHLFRNSQRPLYIGKSTNSSGPIVFASEKMTCLVGLEEAKVYQPEIKEVEQGYVHSIDLNGVLTKGTKYCSPSVSTPAQIGGGHEQVGKSSKHLQVLNGPHKEGRGSEQTGSPLKQEETTPGVVCTDNDVNDVLRFLRKNGLSVGATACFRLLTVTLSPSNVDILECKGEIWVPGFQPLPASYFSKSTARDFLSKAMKYDCMEATLSHLGNSKLYVKDLNESFSFGMEDFLNNKISDIEYNLLTGRISCHCCTAVMHDVHKDRLKDSLLYRGDTYSPMHREEFRPGEYVYICDLCINEYLNGELPNASDEYQIVDSAVQGRKWKRKEAA